MQSPYITLHVYPLYQNLIGELQYIGYYPSIHYKNFMLNLKAIDQIIEIILTDKFAHKLFQNLNKVQRTTL
ncbi:unnamed protein product [Paramecium octaurelia]|uniref:Uncharacterized protein n=1 Tax=Paramecium octaurelia TaxID=43137 RepID=A0A8S1U8C3_PAROT|nr:unnamed protein product [Paramecium octaurelia]